MAPVRASFVPIWWGNPDNAPHTLVNWFNTSAFAAVPAGQFHNGSASRGSVRGPGFGRWDVSLFKNLKLTERVNSQFRGSCYITVTSRTARVISTNTMKIGGYGRQNL